MLKRKLWWMPAVAAVALLSLASCKKEKTVSSENSIGSLLFGDASPEVREALTTPVNFRITEANYSQWEQAQRFLEAVPRSDFASPSGARGNAIDRAVATLEASPRARTAIERTGLSVRDFVLETVALAQASEAAAGRAPNGVIVLSENVQFVQRYQSRILQARAESRRARVDAYTEEPDTMSIGLKTTITPEVGPTPDVPTTDSATKPPADTARDTTPP